MHNSNTRRIAVLVCFTQHTSRNVHDAHAGISRGMMMHTSMAIVATALHRIVLGIHHSGLLLSMVTIRAASNINNISDMPAAAHAAVVAVAATSSGQAGLRLARRGPRRRARSPPHPRRQRHRRRRLCHIRALLLPAMHDGRRRRAAAKRGG